MNDSYEIFTVEENILKLSKNNTSSFRNVGILHLSDTLFF